MSHQGASNRSLVRLILSQRVANWAACIASLAACVGRNDTTDTSRDADDLVVDLSSSDAGANAQKDGSVEVPPSVWVYILGRPVSEIPASNDFPGPDICSVSFVCPSGSSGYAIEAVVHEGYDFFEDSENYTYRYARDAAEATGPADRECRYPQSTDEGFTFVSLGEEGSIFLRLSEHGVRSSAITPADMAGCVLRIQVAQRMADAMSVSLCADARPDDCTPIAEVSRGIAADGIEMTIPTD